MKGQGASDVIVTESQADRMVHQLFMSSPSLCLLYPFTQRPQEGVHALFQLQQDAFEITLQDCEMCLCMAQHPFV